MQTSVCALFTNFVRLPLSLRIDDVRPFFSSSVLIIDFYLSRILADAKVTSPFIVRMLYDNNMTYNIVEAASEVTGER